MRPSSATRMVTRLQVAAWATCLALCSSVASLALEGGGDGGSPPSQASAPAGTAPEQDPLWEEASQLERQGRLTEREDRNAAVALYLRAAGLFENLIESWPDAAAPYWRAARSFWLAGEITAREAVETRIRYFERGRDLATLGIGKDPECAECMLWKFSNMGRIRTSSGGLTKRLREIRGMADLLDRGIALKPTYSDDENNSTLGNLYYSRAIFYRVLPDWFWLDWLLGVKGDKKRALSDIQSALEIHPERLDFRVELGSQLLCLGSRKKNDKKLAEGRHVLEVASTFEPRTLDDERELEAAQIMLEHPAKACGYAGDTWVEVDSKAAMSAAREDGEGDPR